MKIDIEGVSEKHQDILQPFLKEDNPTEWLEANMNGFTESFERHFVSEIMKGNITDEPYLVDSLQESMYILWLSLGNKPLQRTNKNVF